MEEKSEALRLADAMSLAFPGNLGIDIAAAELRRLVAEHEEDQRVIAVWRGRTQRAEAQRDALRAALKEIVAATDSDEWNPVSTAKARAAIKAVEEGK